MKRIILNSIVGILTNGLTALMFAAIITQKHLSLMYTANKVMLGLLIVSFICSLISLVIWEVFKYGKLLWLPKLLVTSSCMVGIPLFLFIGYFYILIMFDMPVIPSQH